MKLHKPGSHQTPAQGRPQESRRIDSFSLSPKIESATSDRATFKPITGILAALATPEGNLSILRQGINTYTGAYEKVATNRMQPNSASVSVAKKQHFVPQFLLRNFGSSNNPAAVWTFDKRTGRAYLTAIRDTAHENRFYEGTNLDQETIKAEDLTAFADGLSAAAIKDVLANERIELRGRGRVSLSYCIAMQILRVPNTRNAMMALQRKIVEKWGPEIRAEGDDRPISAYSDEDSKFASIMALQGVPEFAKILQKKTWFLLKTPRESSFTLSDNPVVRHNHLDYGPRGSLGIAQDGIEVTLPISPSLALQCTCPKIAALMVARGGWKRMRLQLRGLPIPIEGEGVTFLNSLQVIRSERYLYAGKECDFELARDMLREHSDLSKPASAKVVR